jgi:predicted Zn-dependent protease
MIMKTYYRYLSVLTSVLILSYNTYSQKDWIFAAMKDEMTRTLLNLKIDTLKPPYYVGYSVIESESHKIQATLGSLLSSSNNPKSRLINIQLRVGSYSFDNSNFLSYAYDKSGVVYVGEDGTIRTAFEDDYSALRHDLWLATDAVYKSALANLSKKKAALENKIRSDTTSDFSPIKPFVLTEKPLEGSFDKSTWEEKVKKLSAVFKKFPEIQSSKVEATMSNDYIYFLNSDEAKNTHVKTIVGITVTAKTQALDGMPLNDFITFYGRTQKDIPSDEEMLKQIEDMATELTKLRSAIKLDSYSGPVLFQDQAAAEVIAQGLGNNFCNSREPIVDNPWLEQEIKNQFNLSPLLNKVGARILPEFISVSDKPSMSSYNSISLIGARNVDEEGVKPVDVSLVEKGKLKSLLTSRMPHKRIPESNDHGRGFGPQAFYNNLFVSAEKKSTDAELKKNLIEMCSDLGLEYGILIRKINNPYFKQMIGREEDDYFQRRTAPPFLLEPIVAYKIYKDGREEMVRGIEFDGMTIQSFKEIIAVSNSEYIYNHLARQPKPTLFQTSNPMVSVVTPSLLFESIDLKGQTKSYQALPIVSRPTSGN